MKWFGREHGAPYEFDCERVLHPIGAVCAWCEESIDPREDGLLIPALGDAGATHHAFHYECHMRSIIGGLNHLRGHCTCCGGAEPPDPPELSRRTAAIAALVFWDMRSMVRQ